MTTKSDQRARAIEVMAAKLALIEGGDRPFDDEPDDYKGYACQTVSGLLDALDEVGFHVSGPDTRRDRSWYDPECGELGCQSLVWKMRYESAVKGRSDFRRAFKNAVTRYARAISSNRRRKQENE
jgi:hypothetical protein